MRAQAPPGPSPAPLHRIGQRTERTEIRGSEPFGRHTHHTLRFFTLSGPPTGPTGPTPPTGPTGPNWKAEKPVWLFSLAAAVHGPVLGGGGMAEPGITVLGGGGMTDPDSAVLGGGGIGEQEERAVLGGGGITDPDSAVHGGSGISDPDSAVHGGGGISDPDSAVLGGGGITGPSGPKSKWDVLQVQLAGELSHSKSGGES